MNDCRRCRPLLAEAYYKELSASQQEWVDAHLKECPQCAAEFRKMTSVLDLMNRRSQQDPGEDFWSGYYARLQTRMAQPVQKAAAGRAPIRKWILQTAAAVAFLTIGLLIGRFYSVKPAVPVIARMHVSPVDARTVRFLERSQVLLVGMIHVDAASPQGAPELSRQKEISHELVREASYLKEELNDPRERKLQQLISELQVILIEIANMENESDLQSVEMVKSGVDRKGILLKINLEQMRRSDQEFQGAAKPRL